MLLNSHSYYSLRYGTISENDLLQLAMAHGYQNMALTDINNTSACLNFIRLAPNYKIRPIVGIDFRNGAQQHFVGLAKNNQGFLNLNRFLSHHSHQKLPIPDLAPELEETVFIYPFERVLEIDKNHFKDHEFVGIKWQDLKRLRFSPLFRFKDKLVVQQPVTFKNKAGHNLHRLLRAIDNNVLLSKLPKTEQAIGNEMLLPYQELVNRFEGFEFIVRNTQEIVGQCHIRFDFSKDRKPQNKKTYSGSADEDVEMIHRLCEKGLKYRYPKVTTQIRSRLYKELHLIIKQEFVPFFLINWDIVRYAKDKGYYHVGRGSGANSIVAYLLGITDVDPIELDLYFERFMNLFRTNPPDFDIDFSWRDREDVTRYIFDRFGQNGQVALIATYNTFKHSAAVRELGKVFGLPKHEIDHLSSGRYEYEKLDKLAQLTLLYSERLQGMPNYLSVHAGGILVSERPIHYFTATDLPPKGFPTTQFDMVVAEDVGLFKYDILGQRGLSKIKEALQIVKQNQPNAPGVDIHNVKQFIEDPNINKMVSQAQCIGCFYVESPAMRMLLRKLEVDSYLGLVAASSIIRPGVAKSGMMREYILRHKDPERRKRAHPVMWDLMEETYGVMVYQEDVIKVAHYFAGLTLGEADVLRRGMSGKFRSREEFQKAKKKFFDNCHEKGYGLKLVNEIWKQIESFAGYAFAKGHSASYAVESYQSLYLKRYYPLEYMVATINNGGGFYRAEFYIHEARMEGANVYAPHINKSRYATTIEGKDIFLGFHFLKGLETSLVKEIILERSQNGPFKSLQDFMQRVHIGMEQLDILIRIKAFDPFNENKRNLLWQAHIKSNHQKGKVKHQTRLFDTKDKEFQIPKLPSTQLENTFDEIELLGFPLASPFSLLKEVPTSDLRADRLKHYVNKTVTIYGYLVTVKNTSTAGGKRMNFGTFLDSSGNWIDTVHFPPVAKKYPFRGRGVYQLTGKVVSEFDFLSLEITAMEKMPYVQDKRFALG